MHDVAELTAEDTVVLVLSLVGERSSKALLATEFHEFNGEVSPDGRWLAYTLERPNYHRDLVLHEFASGRDVTVSDGLADVAAYQAAGNVAFTSTTTPDEQLVEEVLAAAQAL